MLQNRALLAICLAVGTAFIAIGMVVPVRVLYAQSHGASLAIIGAMASSFLVANFVFQYPTSWLADMLGRKRIMLAGLLAQAVFSLVYLVVTDPILFVVLRFCEGAMAASVLPSARALIADIVPDERRGEAYGIFSSFFNAGFLLGPAVGGAFAVFGYSPAFFGSAVFRLAAFVVVFTLVHEGARHTSEERHRAQKVPRRAFFTVGLMGAYILTFGDNLYFGFELTLMPLWMRYHLGASVTLIGLSYVAWALPNMIGSPFGGRVADRARRSGLILVFGLAQVPLYFIYALTNSLPVVIVVFVIHGSVYSLIQPAVDAHLAAFSPRDARARVQGLYSAAGLCSAFVAASVLPILYGVNYRLPLLVVGTGLGVLVIIGATVVRTAERRAGATTYSVAASAG